MAGLTRRAFLSGSATAVAFGLGPAAYALSQRLPVSLFDFGAVADGTYDPGTREMTGTDNTAAINAALSVGEPVSIPPGLFYYAGMLHTSRHGSGLIGSGAGISFLITDRSLDRHLAVVAGTRDTKWVNFGMIGPHITDGDIANRAFTIGSDSSLNSIVSESWDATGTWIDELAIHGYCVGLHVAHGDHVQFGSLRVYEAGYSKAEPGSYGLTCSGSNLHGKSLIAANSATRARHALYYTGTANDCFVEVVEASGFDLAAVQNRCTAGGGRRNGFGRGRFVDCNKNVDLEPVRSVRGVVNFGSVGDVRVAGAGGARIGDYEAVDCGGFPGPSLRYMPRSRCGTVRIQGENSEPEGYGAHVYRSDDTELPLLTYVACSSESTLTDRRTDLLVVEDSAGCFGGGIRCVSS